MGPDASNDDESTLDEVFNLSLDCCANGSTIDLETLLRGRTHLRERAEGMVALAREVALGQAPGNRERSLPRVAGFTILEEIGRGGMGIVYRARQESLGRIVALKILAPALMASAHARERFAVEARAQARLRHRHIVTVYDVVAGEGLCAYAMEWVDGPTLAQAIGRRDGTLNVQRVAHLGVAIARALQVVHEAGLVHRDVKPSNILLRSDGTPLLSDFSLVRDTDAAHLTATGEFLGTLAYASPEQVQGAHAEVGPRSDVYSLGVTLYTALAGAAPFMASSKGEMIRRIEDGHVAPLEHLAPRVPRDLVNVVGKAMARAPAHRYQSADEFADDLERFLRFEPVHAKGVAWPTRVWRFAQRRPGLVTSAVLAALLVIGTPTALFFQERTALQREKELRKDADDQRQAAVIAEAKARDEAAVQSAITGFLRDMIQRGDASQARGRANVTLLEALNEASEELLAAKKNYQPPVAYAIRTAIADLYVAMGKIGAAAEHLAVAEEARKIVYPGDSEEAGSTAFHLGRVYRELDRLEDAERMSAEAVRVRRAVLERFRDSPDRPLKSNYLAQALSSLGIVRRRRADYEGARVAYEEALALYTETLGPTHENVAMVLQSLGSLHATQKQYVEAEAHFRRALAIATEFHRKDGVVTPHLDIAMMGAKLGSAVSASGRPTEGEVHLREGFVMARSLVGLAHSRCIDIALDLADHLERTQQSAELESHVRSVLAACEELESFGSLRSIRCATKLVDVLLATNRPAEAESLLLRGLDAAKATAEAQGWQERLATARSRLGR